MVPFGKTLTNAMGFREQNKRLAERKSGQHDRDYDYPLQPVPVGRGRYGELRYQYPRIPYREPPWGFRTVRGGGPKPILVPLNQLDGRRIDDPRNRPYHHHDAPLHQPSFDRLRDSRDCPTCDDSDDGGYGPYIDPYDHESLVASFDDLTLGRRPSYVRNRPHPHNHRHLTPPPHYHHHPTWDVEDHHHDHHRHHMDHQRPHGHSPHRGHHGHKEPFDSDEIDGPPGRNRVSGMWESDPYRTGHWVGHGHSASESSDHGSTSTW